MAPLDSAMLAENAPTYRHYRIDADWRTLDGYFARLEKQGIGINIGTYVGATSVREMVLGYGDRTPTPNELRRMQDLVARAMREGALGVSTALQYPPAPYAKTDELIALAATASRYGGIYATHMRSEGDAEMAALHETFRIAREAHIPVEIFHLKTAGKANWGKMPRVVARIDSARRSGLDITADTYAYTAWENTFSAFVPPWAHDGGTARLIERLKDPAMRARIRKEMLTPSTAWDNEWQEIPGPHSVLITAVNNRALLPIQGKRLDEIAAMWHEDAIDALFDVLVKDDAQTSVAVFGMAEPDAIRKFTALPAQREHLADRGVIKNGMWADLVVFDPDSIRDVATYEKPNQLSVGMRWVLVNGVPVIADGKMTGARPGKVLYGPGYEGKQR